MAAWQSWSPSDCRPIALRPYLSIGLPILLIFVYLCSIFLYYIIIPYIRQRISGLWYVSPGPRSCFNTKKNGKYYVCCEECN